MIVTRIILLVFLILVLCEQTYAQNDALNTNSPEAAAALQKYYLGITKHPTLAEINREKKTRDAEFSIAIDCNPLYRSWRSSNGISVTGARINKVDRSTLCKISPNYIWLVSGKKSKKQIDSGKYAIYPINRSLLLSSEKTYVEKRIEIAIKVEPKTKDYIEKHWSKENVDKLYKEALETKKKANPASGKNN